MIIFPFKLNGNWGYVQRAVDVPATASVTWEQNLTGLSVDEEKYFSSECLSFDEVLKTATFDHTYFNTYVRNVMYADSTTIDGKQIEWLERRRSAYPPIGDQLDMMYNDERNGTTTWRDSIVFAKASTPKPRPA